MNSYSTLSVGLQIVVAPLAGFALAGSVAFCINTTAGFAVVAVMTCIGFVAGIIWATSIWKRHGTINWLSRISHLS